MRKEITFQKKENVPNGVWVKRKKWTQDSLLAGGGGGDERKKEKKLKKKNVWGYQRQKKGSGAESPRGHGGGSAEPAD